MNKWSWTVSYGCSKWNDKDEFFLEFEARERYGAYCKNPPQRAGEMAKWVALKDDQGQDVAGFATGGNYGKVQ